VYRIYFHCGKRACFNNKLALMRALCAVLGLCSRDLLRLPALLLLLREREKSVYARKAERRAAYNMAKALLLSLRHLMIYWGLLLTES
jgi:hypothetical protein